MDLNAQDHEGRTSILVAAGNGHEAVVRLLLEQGADIESKSRNGRTPLQLAACNGSKITDRRGHGILGNQPRCREFAWKKTS